MANRKIAFEIEIKGTKALVNNITDVQLAIRETQKALKETADDKEVERLEKQLVQLRGQLKNLTREQRVLQDQFAASDFGADSVEALTAEVKGLTLQYNRLSRAQREAGEGKELQNRIAGINKEIRDIRTGLGKKSLGSIIGEGLKEQIPILGNIQSQLSNIGGSVGKVGTLLQGGFAAFAIAGEVAAAVGEFKAFVDETIELRRQIAVTFGAVGDELDELTTKIAASTATFGTDFQETIEASNAVVQTFGTDSAKSVELLDKALLGVRDRQKFLGDITTDVEKLAGLGVGDESAIALIANAGNLDFNVDTITKPLAALREQSDATKNALIDAFGRDTAAQIFAEFEKEPLRAIQTVSSEFAKLDDKSAESAAVLKDVFRVRAGGEDLATIKSLQNISVSLDELAESAGAAATREQQLLEANQEFAAAQNEIAKRLESVGTTFEVVAVQAKTFFLNALIAILDIFQPLIDAGRSLISTIFNLVAPLFEAGEQTGFLVKAFQLLVTVFTTTIRLLSFIVEGVGSVITGFINFIAEIPGVQFAIGLITGAFEALIFVIERIPALFAGIAAAARQVGTNIANFFRRIAIQTERFALQAAESLGADNNERIAELNRQLDRINEESIGIGQAFTEAYNGVLEENARAQREAAEQAAAEEEARQKEELQRLKEQQEAVLGEQDKARAVRTNKDIKDDRDRERRQQAAAKESVKIEAERTALILELTDRLIDQQIALLEEGEAQQLAAEDVRFERVKRELENSFAEQIDISTKQRAKLLELFGENSAEVLAFDQQAAEDLAVLQSQFDALELQASQEHEKNKQKIRDDAKELRFDERKAELEEIRTLVSNAQKRELLQLQEQTALQLANAALTADQRAAIEAAAALEEIELRRRAIVQEQRLLDDRENALTEAANLGIEIAQSEFDDILTARQELNTELAKLQEQQTQKTKEEADKRKEIEQQALNDALTFSNDTLSLIGEFANAAQQRQENRLQAEADSRALRIEGLQEELNSASGLEKKFIEQQIGREEAAAKRIADSQIEQQKRAAAADKAIKIGQAAINGALAITNILANVVDPTLIGGFKIAQIAFAAAQTAAAIATIAAQPLATGGVAGVQPVQQGAGRVVALPNIVQQSNGDNVLATLKRGEVVLNARQQAAAGGPSFFRSIGVPGFQTGGRVGAPISAPAVANSANRDNAELIAKIEELNTNTLGAIGAVNARIDRMQVVLSTDELRDFTQEQDDILKNTILE